MKAAPPLPPMIDHRKFPVGVVLSQHGFDELRSYGTRFPCRVAVDPKAPAETVSWFFSETTFAPFRKLIRQ